MYRRLAKLIAGITLGGSFLLLSLAVIVFWESRDLPSAGELRGQLWTRYKPKGLATWVPLWAISPKLQTAVVISEDPRFYFHHGFDYLDIWRAFLEDLRVGAYRRGGSTITEQVAKNLFLTREKTLARKLREAVLTWRLERALTKDEILEIYLNIAEWGDGIGGAEAASRSYFSKSAEELTWSEAALLAAILPNAHRFNPFRAPQEAKRLRQIVLMSLVENEAMTFEEFRQAIHAPCCANPNPEKPEVRRPTGVDKNPRLIRKANRPRPPQHPAL
jgi:monofunctional biosynthetic peptidoglycan transglycosylase